MRFVVGFLALAHAEPLTPAQFDQVRQLVLPRPDEEKWTQIPWRTSLWEARREAAQQDKPIFLWEMDGNPLGCT